MVRNQLFKECADLTGRYGNYISLGFNFSNGEVIPTDTYGLFLKRLIRIIADFSKKPFSQLRILDLGSYEGLFSVELSRLGAEVVGIEGRVSNIAKAEFLKKFCGVSRVTFIHDDVRNLTKEKYGEFDIVFAAGILYHLDAASVFKLVNAVYDVCSDFTLIDTQVSLSRCVRHTFKNFDYWGLEYNEPIAGLPKSEQDINRPQDSIENEKSFWPTKISLYNFLGHAGFTSLGEICYPAVDNIRGAYDRLTVIARRGSRIEGLSEPLRRLPAPPLKEIIGGDIIVQTVNSSGDLGGDAPKGILFHQNE